jgi:hypothetical protein
MALRDLMLADLSHVFQIIRAGEEAVPTWHILTPSGDYVIMVKFNADVPDQRERAFALVPRFMAWKLATAFVMTGETWLGPERSRSGEEAVLAIGVSRTERLGVIRRIVRKPGGPLFLPPEWLRADQIDESYFNLLPAGVGAVTAEEVEMLNVVFGENGEMPAVRQ